MMCVEICRRKGKEELHPALKWDWRLGTAGGFAVRRSISGCVIFVNLEPRLRNYKTFQKMVRRLEAIQVLWVPVLGWGKRPHALLVMGAQGVQRLGIDAWCFIREQYDCTCDDAAPLQKSQVSGLASTLPRAARSGCQGSGHNFPRLGSRNLTLVTFLDIGYK